MKKIILCITIIFYIGLLSGCTINEKKASPKKEIEQALGIRKMKLNIPEESARITSYYEENPESIRIAGNVGNIGKVWESKDQGENWEVIFSTEEVQELSTMKSGHLEMTLSPSSEVVIQYYMIDGVEGTQQDYLITKEGKSQRIQLAENESEDSYVSQYKFTKDGELYALDEGNRIHHIDKKNGQSVKSFKQLEVKDFIHDFTVVGKKLIVLEKNDLRIYDIETGEKEELPDKLKEIFNKKDVLEGELGETYQTNLFCYQQDGIVYQYDFTGNKLLQLVDLKADGVEEGLSQEMFLGKEGDLTIVELYFPGEPSIIYRYSPANKKVKYEETLKIYALEENTEMKKMIEQYRMDNPTVEVVLEIGVSDENAITKTDAINLLNTKLLAGEGPDIIVLDGLNIEGYEKQDILLDISMLVQKEVDKGEVFGNLLEAYRKDGKVYAIPTKFSIPTIVGKKEFVEKVENISELQKRIAKNGQKKGVLGESAYPLEMMKILYYKDVENWIAEDGKMNKDTVEHFFSETSDIYKMGGYKKKNYEKQLEKNITPMSANFKAIFYEEAKVAFREIENWSDVEMLYQLYADQEMLLCTPSKRDKNYYIPKQVVGIYSKGNNIERAQHFVSSLCQPQAQQILPLPWEGEGLPINKVAFEYCLSRNQAYVKAGGYMLMDGRRSKTIREMPLEERKSAIKWIEQMNTPILVDTTFTQYVLEMGEEYLDGDMSASEVTNKIVQYYNIASEE